jgi:hypothetical protein
MNVLHKLISMDAPQTIRLRNLMLKDQHDGLTDPQLLCILNEAYFQLIDYLNSRNKSGAKKLHTHFTRFRCMTLRLECKC